MMKARTQGKIRDRERKLDKKDRKIKRSQSVAAANVKDKRKSTSIGKVRKKSFEDPQ
jgi:hypothetical protein